MNPSASFVCRPPYALEPQTGVSENRGPSCSTLNSRILIKGPQNTGSLIFGNSQTGNQKPRAFKPYVNRQLEHATGLGFRV